MTSVKGGLKIIVLKILTKKENTGFGIIKEIEKETGFWKPSPGSIYPLMNELLKKKLVTVRKEKNQKIYTITKEGKEVHKTIQKNKEDVVKSISDSIKFYEALGESKVNLKVEASLLKKIEKEDIPYKENLGALIELRKNLLIALDKNKNPRKLNKILIDTIIELKKI